ncbi:hypothetical protein CC85DRAFT_282573 [Cutaneotrichosporon oleaginosum]|uniref:EamA domain-containing protein n=1 Tax=Cutaneotrichosporon oleaginosum TaxID=879819 RepID=A0A0J0XWP4_9TREE|nr:uncharacterized protein CC85DRAFT_282573 [Cutaneotrichosporon oleaginosum]KLT45490.1 hypothetical protein CC85DRAFT_282573 [Cutaneotrichosporon oleaginosum]TXT14554.1 hypothetical protein COLE_00747 [Cutaneotrichosporon oleaginosum]
METDELLAKMPSEFRPRGGLFPSTRRYLVGVGLLLCVVLLWTASNFITNDLETGDHGWNKPFLITYLNTSSFAFYLIPVAWRYWRKRGKQDRGYSPLPQEENGNVSPRSTLSYGSPSTTVQNLEDGTTVADPPLEKLSIRETAEIAAWWSAVWFLANWSLNAALAMASVASVTILSSTTSFFTLTLGRMFGVEDVTRAKVFSAVASFIGVILVTRSDSTSESAGIDATGTNLPTHPILGDVLSLLSAAWYSIYVILLKVRIGDESRVDTQLLLGFAGLYNIVFLIPAFPLLHYSGIETFEFPPTSAAWTIIGINMLITLSSDYLYVLAMLKTTPLLVTIGLSLTIPFALIGSLVVPSAHADSITSLTLLGAGLVVGSFLVLGWQGWESSNALGLEESERDN